jgi:hypothetical protein
MQIAINLSMNQAVGAVKTLSPPPAISLDFVKEVYTVNVINPPAPTN